MMRPGSPETAAIWLLTGLPATTGIASGTLKKTDRANEPHPNLNGFRKLARKFRKTLLKHLD